MPLSPSQLNVLHPAFHASSLEAAAELARWLRLSSLPATVTLDHVTVSDIDHALNLQDVTLFAHVMGVAGWLTGTMTLAFEHRAGLALAGLLSSAAVPPLAWGEMETSAVQESANIVASAYLNALHAHLSHGQASEALLPTPPVWRQGAAKVLLGFDTALPHDFAFLARTALQPSELGVNWYVLLTLDAKSVFHLLKRLPDA